MIDDDFEAFRVALESDSSVDLRVSVVPRDDVSQPTPLVPRLGISSIPPEQSPPTMKRKRMEPEPQEEVSMNSQPVMQIIKLIRTARRTPEEILAAFNNEQSNETAYGLSQDPPPIAEPKVECKSAWSQTYFSTPPAKHHLSKSSTSATNPKVLMTHMIHAANLALSPLVMT